jgi:MoaA/NifB/PqqE/SkfB family radical SAM enzyme
MPFCSALTNHCCINVKQNYTPCCRFLDDQGNFFSINHYSLKDYKKTNFFINLEKEIEYRWPSGCSSCRSEEENNIISLRQRYNNRMSGKKDRLEFIELSTSNHCNLTCKMCNNDSSSKWQSVLDKNPELSKNYDFIQNIENKEKFLIEKVLENLDLEFLKTVKFLGGEPFITSEITDLIDFFIKKNVIGKINFRCNTNCTFYPKKLINKLLMFNSLEIHLSIDGTEDLCNFIRTGEEWNIVSIVIDQWLELRKNNPKVKLVIHNTLQALNLHQFDKVKNFAKEKKIYFHYIILKNPLYLSLNVLPKEYINYLIESRLLTDEKMINFALNSKYNKDLFEKFRSYIFETDKILGTDISKVIPNLNKFLI